jgi:hypothetical protein
VTRTKISQPAKARLIAGLLLVTAAVLLLLLADLSPAVAAATGVPGLALMATSRRGRG